MAKSLNFTYSVEILKFSELAVNITSKKGFLELSTAATNEIPESISVMVRNKTVAFAACAFTINDKNKFYLNFTAPISTQVYTFLVARPRELSRALLFMSPFSGDVSII